LCQILCGFTTALELFSRIPSDFSPLPRDSAASFLPRKLAFQNGKIFSTFRILYVRDSFLLKRKRKFFGFGSPASFSKEPDAESHGFGGRGFYIFLSFVFSAILDPSTHSRTA
jgi:hypothetical protein